MCACVCVCERLTLIWLHAPIPWSEQYLLFAFELGVDVLHRPLCVHLYMYVCVCVDVFPSVAVTVTVTMDVHTYKRKRVLFVLILFPCANVCLCMRTWMIKSMPCASFGFVFTPDKMKQTAQTTPMEKGAEREKESEENLCTHTHTAHTLVCGLTSNSPKSSSQ